MKKLFLSVFALATALYVSAQEAAPSTPATAKPKKEATPEQKAAMKNVRETGKEIKADKQAIKDAKKSGDQAALDNAKAEMKADRQKMKDDVKAAKDAGVKHPMKRAHRQGKKNKANNQ